MSFQGEQCPDRVADILEACGALDPGSSPGRDVLLLSQTNYPLSRRMSIRFG